MTKFKTLMACFALLASLAVLAEETIRIDHPWVRASIVTNRPTAAYMAITSTVDDKLLSVSTPVAMHSAIHAIVKENGISKMVHQKNLLLPARRTIKLAPGGIHLMLMKLKQPVIEGSQIELTLRFEKAGEKIITIPVQPIGAMGDMAGH